MKTPKSVKEIELVATCVGITQYEWDKLMKGTTKANGQIIRNLIKNHIPSLYSSLCLDYYNPFESRSVKKEGLLVYVHSGIEYFLKYK